MNKPLLKLLVIDDSEIDILDITKHLNLFQKTLEMTGQVHMSIDSTQLSDKALETIRQDGDIQAVLLDWFLEELGQEAAFSRRNQTPSQYALIDAIKQIRPEIPIYILTSYENSYDIDIHQFSNVHYFHKEDFFKNPSNHLDRILTDFNKRREAPFWESLRDYVNRSTYSWHTPGHSGGASFNNSPFLKPFFEFYGANTFRSDLSVSVEQLGSLLQSSGPLGKAQDKAAITFGVKHSYFSTNGSSTTNKIILQTLLKPGDIAIIDSNCHKSVHYGLIQSGAKPVFLRSRYNDHLGIFAPPSLSEIEAKLKSTKNVRLLVITGCTYEGLLIDTQAVVALAHNYGVKVLIDEAWFAYSGFHPAFRKYSAIHSGADYVTHSAHKVLSTFSQGSFIHINDPDFDKDFFTEIFYTHTSTSPQYQIIASLDVAAMQMQMEGYKLISSALYQAQRFRDQCVNEFRSLKVLNINDFGTHFSTAQSENIGLDPLKVLIDVSGLKVGIKEVHNFLKSEGIEIEKSTHSSLLFLFTIGTTNSKEAELFNALKKLDSGVVKLSSGSVKYETISDIPPLESSEIRSAFYSTRRLVSLETSFGCKSAFLVTPYPPGVPILVPGQIITDEHIRYLKRLIKNDFEIHGCFDREFIYVIEN